ncbi:MAG TPA: enoyl-CoA hydratase-related protein [Candidatus Eremiobacteraceae bacterium]|nr:enoyl-CoA hydratase-related protein [Candidatus Eremiobacteraceae bacterium]
MAEATATYSNLLVEAAAGVGVITVNRPPANALSSATLDELNGALDALVADENVRAIIITGAGQYVFVGGADITEFLDLAKTGAAASVKRGMDLFDKIENLSKPVVAAVNGVCAGGGMELALACDVRFASESAKFGMREVTLGIIPGWGGNQRLPRLVGRGRAMEMLLTGDWVTADAAARMGLVNRVFPDNELLTQARNFCRRLATTSGPVAMRYIKQGVNAGIERGMRAGLEADIAGVETIMKTKDAAEGVTAFLGKRRPKFTGQ